MITYNTIIAKITDWGVALIKDKLSEDMSIKEIRRQLQEYGKTQFDLSIYNSGIDSEIDYVGLIDFLNNHISDVQKYIFSTDTSACEKLLAHILSQAEYYSNANHKCSKDVVQKFVYTIIKLIKDFYINQLPNNLKLAVNILNESSRVIVRKQDEYHEEILKELESIQNHVSEKGAVPTIAPIRFLTERPATLDRIIGRDDEIEDFVRIYGQNNKVLIMGVGGIGKSEFAKGVYWYCTELYETYQYFGWMAFDKDIQYTFIKYIKGDFVEKTVTLLFKEIMDYLEQLNGRILLIIDNVPANIEVINQIEKILLHSNNLSIVLTSRITELEGYEPYLVEPLEMNYCLKLFFMYAQHIEDNPSNRLLVRDIIEKIASHTLSIEVIAKSSWINKINLVELHKKILEFKYPKDFKLPVKIMKDEVFYQDYCFELLKYIFNDVTTLNDYQKEILFFLSALPYQEYSFDLVLQWVTDENLGVLNELIKCGWLQAKANQIYTISVHPLIAEVSINSLDIEIVKYSKYFKNIRLWNEQYEDNFNFISQNSAIFTELFLRYENQLKPDIEVSKDIIYLGDSGVNMLHSLADYEKACELCNKVIEAKKRVFGAMSIEVIDSYNNLAVIYKDLKKYNDAFAVLNMADKMLLQFPENLEEKAKIYNSMAGVYRVESNIPKCIEYLERALYLRERCLKPDDKLIATTCNNLATLYRDNGKPKDAKKLLRKAIKILHKLPDKEHPHLATAYYNYGLIFMIKEEQNTELAKKYVTKAYEMRKKSLGISHPHTELAASKLIEIDCLARTPS